MALKIVDVSELTPELSGNFAVSVGSELFEVQSARKAYSITSPSQGIVRFELHDGDAHWWDAASAHASERAELADRSIITNGTPLHISYGFTLEPGAPNTAYFMVLGQLHQDNYAGALPWSPPFAIALSGEKMVIDVRYSGPDGLPVQKQLFFDVSNIKRGHEYQMDIKAVFDPSGDGRLVVERDGVTIAEYSGPLGYAQQNGVYWAEGIYRHANATETVAASYADLKVETGSSVTFPHAANFIGAPEMEFSSIGPAAADGSRVVELTGSAKVGTTVSVSENGTVLGKAKVDADGKYSIKVAVQSSGEHLLGAVATDATGREGVKAYPMLIEIGTAAEIVSRMPTLAKNLNLGTIVVTDAQTLTLASKVQLSEFLSYTSVIRKIEGDVKFRIDTAVTGQPYTKQSEIFSETGVLLERLRYSGTKLTYDSTIGSDGRSVTRSIAGDNSATVVEALNGTVLSSAQINAKGVMTLKTVFNADGSKEIDYFDANTGSKTKASVYFTDGHRTDTYVGLTGKDYTSQTYTYDKKGKNTSIERFNDAGTKIYERSWMPDGSMETHNFGLNGKETSFTITYADGTRVEGSMVVSGKTYSAEVVHYAKPNVMTARERYDAAGHVQTEETFGTNASLKTYAYDAKSGLLTGWTSVAADKTYVVVKVYSGSEDKISQSISYDAAGKVLKTIYYDMLGNTISAPNAAGSTSVYSYDPVTGLKDGLTVKAADGSYSVTKFAAGQESLTLSISKYGPNGKLLSAEVFGEKGIVVSRTAIAGNGDTTIERFDAAGKLTAKSYLHDGLREEYSYAVSDKYYATQSAVYDAADKLIQMTRSYADGKPAFQQTVAADGTQTVKEWSQSGVLKVKNYLDDGTLNSVESYNMAGAKISVQVLNADGSREMHYFDEKTGKETNSLTLNIDKSRTEAIYGIQGKSYAEQIATYDNSGKLVELIRKHGDDAGTTAFHEKYNTDGSSEVSHYDDSGRVTKEQFRSTDGSRDAFSFFYDDASAALRSFAAQTASAPSSPSTTQHDHFSSANVRQWSDVMKADGSHVKTAFVGGVTLASTNASDTLAGFKNGSDTFQFSGATGKDLVLNFTAGSKAGHDVIAIDTALVQDFSHLETHLSKQGADTLIKFDDANSVLVKNVVPDALTIDNFKFIHHGVLSN